LLGNPAMLGVLLADVVPLVFQGGASLQLYFLLVMFLGNMVCLPLVGPLRRMSTSWLVALFGIAAIPCWFLSGHSWGGHPMAELIARKVDLGLPGVPVVIEGLLAAYVTCAICCLALIFGGAMLVRFHARGLFLRRGFRIGSILFLAGLLLNPTAFRLQWLFVGVTAVAVAVAFSPYIPTTRWVHRLAGMSFGVFLVHPLLLQFFLILGAKRWKNAPIETWEFVLMSIAGYLGSLFIVWSIGRLGRVGRAFVALH
jgi:hypothetical protein